MHNVPLGRQGRMHPWEFQSLVSSIFTIARQCAGQLAASSDTNEPRRIFHLAWGWRGWRNDLCNGHLGGRRGLVIGNIWLLLVCGVDSGSRRGVTNHMGVLFVAGLSVTGSCPTSDMKAAQWKAQATVERAWVET
jgi:hypothetical protein